MDPNLTFGNHVLETVSSCMSHLAQINRVKYSFDKQSLIIIINSLVFNFFYCLCVWSNTSQANLKMLQTVQYFACRKVSGRRKYDHVSPALKELRWLPVKEHLYYRDAVMSFKGLTGCAPGYLSTQFIRRCDVTNRRTRSSQMLNMPRFRTASSQRTFFFFFFCESVNVFKHRLRSRLLSNFSSPAI